MSSGIPPALLAQLDQEIASVDSLIDDLAATVSGPEFAGMGRTEGIAVMVLSLLVAADREKLAAIAGAAVMRLVEGRRHG